MYDEAYSAIGLLGLASKPNFDLRTNLVAVRMIARTTFYNSSCDPGEIFGSIVPEFLRHWEGTPPPLPSSIIENSTAVEETRFHT